MPPQPRNARALAREVVFVIDVSGSMKGRSIRQARRAMDAALQRLKPRDRFNIITFSDGAQRLHPSAQPAQPAVVRQARAYVAGLDAGGGTNMAPALKLALSPAAAGHLRQVVFITDGAVGNEEALFRLIHQRLGGSRLFTVGIGSAPNAHFMRVAARFGRGSYTFVDRVGEVEQDIGALFRRIGAPVVRDIRVHWPGDAESYPERIPDLYAGEPLVVAARIGTGEGPVVVEGETDGQSWRRRVQIPAGFGRNGVSVLWARRRIAALMDEIRAGRAEAEVRPDVVATATAHHLVTRYTSLVAVDRAPGRPSGASLKREAVPANLPDGSDPSGFVTVMPRTATAAGMHLIAGLLLLLIAAVAWLLGHLGFRADEAAREP
jgi:Ca-activated chloride channel family protein